MSLNFEKAILPQLFVQILQCKYFLISIDSFFMQKQLFLPDGIWANDCGRKTYLNLMVIARPEIFASKSLFCVRKKGLPKIIGNLLKLHGQCHIYVQQAKTLEDEEAEEDETSKNSLKVLKYKIFVIKKIEFLCKIFKVCNGKFQKF